MIYLFFTIFFSHSETHYRCFLQIWALQSDASVLSCSCCLSWYNVLGGMSERDNIKKETSHKMWLCTPRFTEVTAHPNWTLGCQMGSPSLHKNTRLIPEHPHKSLFHVINSTWCSSRFSFLPQVMLHLLCLFILFSIVQMSVHTQKLTKY